MYSKSLFLIILIRIILITISSFAFIAVIPHLNKEYYFSLFGIGIVIIFQIYLLVNYLNKTNQVLTHFFETIRYEEPNLIYTNTLNNKILDSLGYSLDELNDSISSMRRENAKQNLFLKNLVEHVGIGLISYNAKGEIDILNNAAMELLRIKHLTNLKDLKIKLPEVYDCICSLLPDNQKLIKFTQSKSVLYLSFKLSIIKSEKETINLISIQNIKAELEQKELDSWQKLIRVLTHEISNSVSPIASLANTTKKYFEKNESKDPFFQKTINNLDTIENTGKGLINFVEQYKSLTALPLPKFEKFLIRELFDRLNILFSENPDSHRVKMTFIQTPGHLEITADFNLLEKVLINLLNNSFQALEKTSNSEVYITAFKTVENKIVISVKDNGKGIPPEIIDDIFIPFYSTKDNGSGIGLSISKQILQLHNASIIVNSIPNQETEFSIIF